MFESINMQEFNYELPEDKIAKFPIEKRDTSKLLVYKSNQIKDEIFLNLTDYLDKNTLLIFNNTKVIKARLVFANENGARIEIFCLEPYQNIPTETAMQQQNESLWICTVGNLKKWKQVKLTIVAEGLTLNAQKINDTVPDSVVIKFSWDGALSFAEVLEKLGKTPLPPYIKREELENDKNAYQTVYAEISGSVAAPTAGLHFTENMINKIKTQGHDIAYTTLHVGAGTFKPVKSEDLRQHHMHQEEIIISKNLLQLISEHSGPLVAVGTTTLRTLESIYWLSHLIIDKELKPDGEFYYLSQWAAYGLQKEHSISFKLSCQRLLHFLEKQNVNFIKAKTQILISPGYRINSINALVTNFHQPSSTLLVLIAALVGEEWKKIYAHALQNNYRFLSYGDSSILFKESKT